MKPFGKFLSTRIAGVGLICAFSLTAGAQVLDQVPADALGVMKIKNMQAVSDKAGALLKQWGVTEMKPETADPLAYFLNKVSLSQGVDKSGEFAIAVANGELDGQEPRFIILLPVSDYDQFLGNFKDMAKDGEIAHFHFVADGEKDNEETFCAHWGKYAAMTPMKDLLAKKPEGFKAEGRAAEELESKDVVWCANFKILGPKLDGMLKSQKDGIIKEASDTLKRQEKFAKYEPLARVVLGQALDAASGFLNDASYVSFGINLSNDGISTSLVAQCKDDSHLGGIFKKMENKSGSLVKGLPEAKYLFLMGGVNSGAGTQLVDDFLQPIEPELAKLGDEVKPVITIIDGMKKTMKATKQEAGGLIAPTGQLYTSSLLQGVRVVTGDPKALISVEKEMAEAQQQLMSMLPNQPNMKVDYKPDAKTVDGVSFSQLSSTMANENDPVAAQVKMMMSIMYGPAGATTFSGAVDDSHLLTYIGLDDATVSAAIKAVKDGADPLAKNEAVSLVDKNLPQDRAMVLYVGLGDIVETFSRYAKMMGLPIPVNMKPNLPPIGISAGTSGASFWVDSFVPSDLVEQCIATGMQLKMMGGGGNGKPGGL
jgi:hypothetical protein